MRKLPILILALGTALWAAPEDMPTVEPAGPNAAAAPADSAGTDTVRSTAADTTKADTAKAASQDTSAEDQASADTADIEAPKAPARKTGARLFLSWELAGEGGILMPMGKLADIFDPAPVAGFRAATSYYGDWRAVMGAHAGTLAGPGTDVLIAVAAAGLEWRTGPAWLPKPGLGLSLTYVRATGEKAEEVEYLYMDDGESEFGIQPSLQWIIPAGPSLRIRAGGRWDMTFTEPAYSHAVSLLAGAAWEW